MGPVGKSASKVNVSRKFSQFRDLWSPRIVGELNDFYIKLVKVKGEFVWHHHKREDEMFLVTKGRLTIKLRGRNVILKPGELFVVRKGLEHKPVAQRETHVLLIERKSTLNTGQVRSSRTVEKLEKI